MSADSRHIVDRHGFSVNRETESERERARMYVQALLNELKPSGGEYDAWIQQTANSDPDDMKRAVGLICDRLLEITRVDTCIACGLEPVVQGCSLVSQGLRQARHQALGVHAGRGKLEGQACRLPEGLLEDRQALGPIYGQRCESCSHRPLALAALAAPPPQILAKLQQQGSTRQQQQQEG